MNLNFTAVDQLSSLICSIEDQFARVLPIEERATLRTPGPEWWTHWAAYNARIGCDAAVGPSAPDANAVAVLALLQYAVMVEYEEHSEAINDSMAASVPITATVQESNCSEAGLHEALPLVSQLCEVLQVPPACSATEPDIARALHSCARQLRIRARADARVESASKPEVRGSARCQNPNKTFNNAREPNRSAETHSVYYILNVPETKKTNFLGLYEVITARSRQLYLATREGFVHPSI